MQSSDGGVPGSGHGSLGAHLVSRRVVLKLSASALAVVAGCEASDAAVGGSVPAPGLDPAAQGALEGAHRLHRMAFLLGDADWGEACALDCTAAFTDHEYGGTVTWH
ncbi:MAG: hypothetical protein ABUL62_19840 [Myxococcales bacterium]